MREEERRSGMEDKISYAVFWKMKPSVYELSPEWRVWERGIRDRQKAVEARDECIRNPRCDSVAIVREVSTMEIEEVFPGGANADG